MRHRRGWLDPSRHGQRAPVHHGSRTTHLRPPRRGWRHRAPTGPCLGRRAGGGCSPMTTDTLNQWMQDDDLFWTTDAGLDAVTVNPMYGSLYVQPWANSDDWTRARKLLDRYGGASDCTR